MGSRQGFYCLDIQYITQTYTEPSPIGDTHMHASRVLYLGAYTGHVQGALDKLSPVLRRVKLLASCVERPANSCHHCGATAYRPMLDRDGSGAMRPNGQYKCVQCQRVFSNLGEWRGIWH